MKWISLNALSVLIYFFSSMCFANNEWFRQFSNARSLGMGGVGVAVSSDETSLYRNPANLGSIRDFYGTFFDPELEGSSNFVRQITAGSAGKSFDLEEVSKVLNSNRQTYYRAKIQLTPSLVRRNVGFGLIYNNQLSAEVDATGSTMDTKYRSDIGAIFGTNLRLFDGRIKIGGSVKAINRIEVTNPALSTAGPFDLATVASEGTGIGYTGGIMIQIPWTYIPTLGAVVHDIGGTQYAVSNGMRLTTGTRPTADVQQVDVGLALFPIHSNSVRSVWSIEYTDVTNARNDTDNGKRAHFGLEINSKDIFFFRLGYNQRYWTAGFEIASERLQWQVSSYGEEVGTELAPREDRRLNTKIAVRF